MVSATPAVLAGCSVGFAFRCGLFNIGAGGQLVMGAIASFVVAHFVGGGVAGMVLGVDRGRAGGLPLRRHPRRAAAPTAEPTR